MTVVRFADSFWDTEWTGTSGVDALTKRMKIGRDTCKDLVVFFKERANIEKDYGSKLQKLAKSMEKKSHNTGESESLENAISKLIVEAENMACLHTNSSQTYADRVEKLSRFHENQKEEKKKIEESLKKVQGQKISQYSKTMSAQRNYHSKCRERDQLKSQFEACQQAVTSQTKDIEKTKVKLEKAELAMQQADAAYKTSIESLEKLRKSWEKEMVEACNKFQEIEEERIAVLRNELWLHCNILSQVCVDLDQCCESTRLQLEKCSIEKDISDFILTCKTGEDHPGKLEYENYHSGTATRKIPTPNLGHRAVEVPAKPARHPVLPIRPPDHSQLTSHHGNNSSAAKKDVIMEGDYAAIDDMDYKPPVPAKK